MKNHGNVSIIVLKFLVVTFLDDLCVHEVLKHLFLVFLVLSNISAELFSKDAFGNMVVIEPWHSTSFHAPTIRI